MSGCHYITCLSIFPFQYHTNGWAPHLLLGTLVSVVLSLGYLIFLLNIIPVVGPHIFWWVHSCLSFYNLFIYFLGILYQRLNPISTDGYTRVCHSITCLSFFLLNIISVAGPHIFLWVRSCLPFFILSFAYLSFLLNIIPVAGPHIYWWTHSCQIDR